MARNNKSRTTVQLNLSTSGPDVTATITLHVKPRVSIISWNLNWADGTSDSGQGFPPSTITHTYPAIERDYTVTVTVTDSTGYTTEDSSVGMIRFVPPTPPPPDPPPGDGEFGNFRPQVQGNYSQITGGRGGSIYRVTTLSGTSIAVGSVRWAFSQSNGVVVFDVGGVIPLETGLTISGSNLTIAGQTAPAPGIFFVYTGNWSYTELAITGANVIVQHITVAGGDMCSSGLFAYLTNDIIFDHVTQLWHQDEGLAAYGDRMLFWRCISGEGLNSPPESAGCAQAGYADVSHGMFIGGTIQCTDITIAQCLMVSNYYRNPAIGWNTLRMVNSLVYNWTYRAWHGDMSSIDASGGSQQSGVGCRFIPGPGNTPDYPVCVALEGPGVPGGPSRIYLDDCTFESNSYLPSPVLFFSTLGYDPVVGTPPVSITNYTFQSSTSLESYLLPKVGARPGAAYQNTLTRQRIITYIGSRTGPTPGLGNDTYPVHVSEVGGPLSLSPTAGTYTDPANPNTVVGPYGRTNRDLYLESLAVTVET